MKKLVILVLIVLGGLVLTMSVAAWSPDDTLVPQGISSPSDDPDIQLYPSTLSAALGSNQSKMRALWIHNRGNYTLTWGLSEQPAMPWLSTSPNAGEVGPGEYDGVEVTFNSSGIAAGLHATNLRVTSDDPDSPQVDVPITLIVAGEQVFLPVAGWSYGPAWYHDDFSDPESEWSIEDYGDVAWGYVGGEYEIDLRTVGWWASLAAPTDKIDDYLVEVSARRHSGAYGGYGLVFGVVNYDHYYIFRVMPHIRYFSVERYDKPNTTYLIPWRFAPAIKTGTATNRLQVRRNGSSFAVYANGQLLATGSDSVYSGPLKVGIYAGTGSVPVTVRFDDFKIWR